MNKKLERIGKIFIDKYLIDFGVIIDEENKIIRLETEKTPREFYICLMDIFDHHTMMHNTLPLTSEYIFYGALVINGWTVESNGVIYKDGDVIKEIE